MKMHGALWRKREGGQGLVEFSLIAPLLFLILFSIIQMGFLLGGQIGLANAARDTARYVVTQPQASYPAAAVQCGTTPTPPPAGACTELRTRAMPRNIPGFGSANVIGGANGSRVAYCFYPNANDDPSGTRSYSVRVRVTAGYRHSLFVPLIGALLDRIDGTADGRLAAQATEEMRVENPPLTSPPLGGIPACP